MVKVRRIIKFEFSDAHDIEFAPSRSKAAVFEVWVDGILIEEMPAGTRPSEDRAHYYHEIHCPALEEAMTSEDALDDAACQEQAAAVH